MKSKPAIFFDRDGVLNVDTHYVHKIEQFTWMEGAIDAVRHANAQGYYAFVVTNQGGIGRGYYTEQDVLCLHAWMNEELQKQGAHMDAFYYCPHYENGKVLNYATACECRKPKAGMIRQATAQYAVDLASSLMLGDKDTDMECARNAGVRGVRFTGGNLYETLRAEMERFKR